ncbi:MAG: sulfite exporter TauE/SafE family protein [Novosphingobium sp.]|nr:sulfite exporter TauE/SafE family protein [Novosphingobium sp.]
MTGLLSQMDLPHALAGLLVGVAVGLTGVGGGSLMTPLLVLIFGVSPQTAVGTDLLFAAATKTAGSGVHGWRETINWPILRRLACGSIPASVVTLIALSELGRIHKGTQHVILIVLGVMLLVTAIGAVFQKRLVAFATTREPRDPKRMLWPTVLLGLFIGVVVSISSVGAGAVGVTALLMLYPQLPVARIVGTDIAHAVPLTLVSGFGHWLIGDVDGVLLANLLLGSIPGVIVASFISSRAPDSWLRLALAAVLVFSGIKLLT